MSERPYEGGCLCGAIRHRATAGKLPRFRDHSSAVKTKAFD
jgi:hypothetical protein